MAENFLSVLHSGNVICIMMTSTSIYQSTKREPQQNFKKAYRIEVKKELNND